MYLDRLLSRVHHYHLFVEGDDNPGGGGAEPPAATALEPGAKPTGTALSAGGDTALDGDTTPPAALPDNWRDLMAGGDEKALRDLARYSKPENVAKALLDLKARVRSGQTLQALPDDASPEEIAAYRKSAGIPEAPDGYGFAFPDDAKPTEADNAALSAFQEFMHGRHVPPAAAKAAFEFYLQNMTQGRAAREEAAQQATLEQQFEMRKAFPGRELQRNMRIADEFAQQHFSEHDELDAFNEVMQARLPNGVKVMDYAPFMKGFFKMARSQADEEALIGSDTGSGGKSIDAEYEELIKKTAIGKTSKADEERLTQLAEARVARENRQQGRSRAA
jgi:hypothetical protein